MIEVDRLEDDASDIASDPGDEGLMPLGIVAEAAACVVADELGVETARIAEGKLKWAHGAQVSSTTMLPATLR